MTSKEKFMLFGLIMKMTSEEQILEEVCTTATALKLAPKDESALDAFQFALAKASFKFSPNNMLNDLEKHSNKFDVLKDISKQFDNDPNSN